MDKNRRESSVDAGMFSKEEHASINTEIDNFLARLNKQRDDTNEDSAHSPMRKRAFLAPLMLAVFSAIFLVSIIFFYSRSDSTQFPGWIEQVFALRVASNDADVASDANREFILEIQNENEARLVSLFVGVINTEESAPILSGEESPTPATGSDEEEATRRGDDESAAFSIEIAALREQLREQTATVEESNQSVESFQLAFDRLSEGYQGADLQVDRYAELANELYVAFLSEDNPRINDAIAKLEDFVASVTRAESSFFGVNSSVTSGQSLIEYARVYVQRVEEMEAVRGALSTLEVQHELTGAENLQLSKMTIELRQQVSGLLTELRRMRAVTAP